MHLPAVFRTMEFEVGGVPYPTGTLRFTGGNNRCAQASSEVDENFVDISRLQYHSNGHLHFINRYWTRQTGRKGHLTGINQFPAIFGRCLLSGSQCSGCYQAANF